jgi:tRNA(Ile2) C34 agmatinyltransferase TiaS
MKQEKPKCPKCGKPMRLISTGSLVRTYDCDECNEREIVKREDAHGGVKR